MTDVHNTATRSYNMSRIRSKDTRPELLVRKYLFSKGYRYRLYDKKLPGKPDIVLPKYKTVIFIHGCFWHGHENCKYFVLPKTRTEWWKAKIEDNEKRDRKNTELLENSGWKVLEVFECELKGERRQDTLEKVMISILKK